MSKVFPILLILSVSTLVACRSRKALSLTSLERHADSVGVLRSIAARELTRETETTFVTMRPDTTGTLVEVSRDVFRTVTRETENAIKSDTGTFQAETMKNTTKEEKTQETQPSEAQPSEAQPSEAKGRSRAFFAGMVATAVLLASGLAAITYAKWKSRL